MSTTDIETTTDDTTDAPNVVATVALEVGKQLVITVSGVIVAGVLTAGATKLQHKVRSFRAARATSDEDTDSVATAVKS